MKKVNKHTRAGQKGKIIQCPKCHYQSVSYHFAWAGSGCVGCDEMIDKYDYLIPEITDEQDFKVREEQHIDNGIRKICYEVNKHLWNKKATCPKDMDNYWKAFNDLYKDMKKKLTSRT